VRSAGVVYQCAAAELHGVVEALSGRLQKSISRRRAKQTRAWSSPTTCTCTARRPNRSSKRCRYAARTRKGQVRADSRNEVLAAHAAGRVRAHRKSLGLLRPVVGVRGGAHGSSPRSRGKPIDVLGVLTRSNSYTFIDDSEKHW